VENKERKRSDDRRVKSEGVWISPKVYGKNLFWKIDERDGKPCMSQIKENPIGETITVLHASEDSHW